MDQLRKGPSTAQRTDSDMEVPTGPEPEDREEEQTPDHDASHAENDAEATVEPETVDSSIRRYPSRVRQPPQRYQ